MSRTIALLLLLSVVQAAGLSVLASPEPIEEFHAFLLPEGQWGVVGQLMELRFEVNNTAHQFNGYEITIEFNPNVLAFDSVIEGALMTGACPNRFRSTGTTATTVTYTHVLLCAGLSIDGPGVLSVFRFRALNPGSSPMTIITNRDRTFADAGLYIWPGHPTYPRQVILHNATIHIHNPTSPVVDPEDMGIQMRVVARPNPSSSATTIDFYIPDPAPVRIDIFDASGRWVRRILDESRPAGWHFAKWDGSDPFGRDVASGLFLARIAAGDRQATERILLLRGR